MLIVPLRAHGWCLAAIILAGTALACGERDAPRSESTKRPGDPVRSSGGAPSAAKSAEDVAPPQPSLAGTVPGPATAPVPGAPPAEFHLDDPEIEYEPVARASAGRKARALELVLRSTPPGAVAAVDGITVGPTPTLWEGNSDGHAREFTFVLPGYAIARYRFVPTQSGVVHGTLGRLKTTADAGPIEPPR
jgi:hypothetical protein